MRINARLGDTCAEKIEYLKEATGTTLSDVVRESVERYYVQLRSEAERRAAGLDELVGAFDGQRDTPTDLSADYKRYLWTAGPSDRTLNDE